MAQIVVSKLNVGDPITKEFLDALCDGVNGAGQVVQNSVPEVLNGGFQYDLDDDGIPDNWSFIAYTGGDYSLEATGGILGSKFFRITHPSGAAPAGGGYIQTPDGLMINVSPDKDVWLSWAHKCSQATNLNVKVDLMWYDGSTEPVYISTTNLYDSTTNPTGWRYFAFSGTPPPTARYVRVRLTGGEPGTDPTVAATTDFSDVRIFEPATTGYVFASETPGSYSVVVPSNCVWMKAAAAGSGGGASGGINGRPAGGAAKIEGWSRVHPGRTLTVVVPAGGTGGAASLVTTNNGTDGAAATITDEDGTVLVSATGGAKGTNTPGAGGTVAFTEDLPNRRHGANGSNGATFPGMTGGNPGQFIFRDIFNNGAGGSSLVSKNGTRGGGGYGGMIATSGGNGGNGFVEVWL